MSGVDILRVVSLNIWNNQGPWPERLRLIRRELPTLDAHLVGLQEVLHLDAGQPPDQAQAIADGLGYYTAFASAWHIGGGLQFGNALLSRFPIVDARAFMLPCEEGDETRALLYCSVDAPCGKIPVFVHAPVVEAASVGHAPAAGRVHHGAHQGARARRPARASRRSCMGDFNAEPDSDEIRYLRGYNARLGRSVYFADCFAVAGDGSPGYTYARDNTYALRAHEPNRRLDYIFVRGPDRALRG